MRVHTVRDLGAAVREARAKRGLTQADLARLAGVSREWLSRLEHGQPRLEAQLVLDTLSAAGLTLTTSESAPTPTDRAEEAWDSLFAGLTDPPSELRPGKEEPADG